MQGYFAHRNILDQPFFSDVDWDANGKAMRASTIKRRHWLTKHTVGACGVNKILVKWGQKASAQCARCNSDESTTHVWKCPHPTTQQCWVTSLTTLRLWMIEKNTCPRIMDSILHHLASWSSGNQSAESTTTYCIKILSN